MPRAFLIVMDSVGIGGAPDAARFFNGTLPDTGANTVGHIAQACANGQAEEGRSGPLHVPNLAALGLGFGRSFAEAGVSGTLVNLLLVQDYLSVPALLGVSWTLSLEFVWYGVFALLFYRGRSFGGAELVLLYAAGLLLVSALSLAIGLRVPVGRLGMLGAALLGHAASARDAGKVSERSFLAAASTFVFAIVVSQIIAFGYFRHPSVKLEHGLVAWLSASVAFLLASSRAVRTTRLVRWPPIVFFGKISYSVYLLHWPVTVACRHAGVSGNTLLFLVPPLTVVLSWGFYEAVERPGVRLGRALESWSDGTRVRWPGLRPVRRAK